MPLLASAAVTTETKRRIARMVVQDRGLIDMRFLRRPLTAHRDA
jgi:hypothetical protein